MGRGAKRSLDVASAEVPSHCGLFMHVQHCWQAHAQAPAVMPWALALPQQVDRIGVIQPVPAVRGSLALIPRFDPCDCSQPEAVMPSRSEASAFSMAGLKLSTSTESWKHKVQHERRAALKKWLALVKLDPLAWEIGRQALPLPHGRGLLESITDALASKATGTLHARAGPLLRFAAFCDENGEAPWPLREDMVYAYFKELSKKCAPTHLRSCLIAMSFAMHVLGLYGGRPVVASGRIRGVAASHYCTKKLLVQRDPLSVQQVKMLERCVVSERAAVSDRLAAGFFLVCLYGRLRYSDALHINSLRMDTVPDSDPVDGFLEATCARTKTMTSLELKTRWLPVAAPLRSVSGCCWAGAWMQLREQHGLVARDDVPLLGKRQVEFRAFECCAGGSVDAKVVRVRSWQQHWHPQCQSHAFVLV